MAAMLDPIITTELLDSLRSQPHLPDDVWYLVIATTLCVLNRPEEVQLVYNYAIGPGHGTGGLRNGVALSDREKLRIVRRLREALLKTSAIGGMPKVRRARAAQCPPHPLPHAWGRLRTDMCRVHRPSTPCKNSRRLPQCIWRMTPAATRPPTDARTCTTHPPPR